MFYGGVGGSGRGAPGDKGGGGGQRSRNERYEQMTKQQELIEQKRREIEAKLEADRHQKAMEALLGKPQNFRAAGPVNSPAKSGTSPAAEIKSWTTIKSEKEVESPKQAVALQSVVFANDGSFMEQFLRLQEQNKIKEEEAEEAKVKVKPELNEYGTGVGGKKPLIKVMSHFSQGGTKSSTAPSELSQRLPRMQQNTGPPSNNYAAVPPPRPPHPLPRAQHQPERERERERERELEHSSTNRSLPFTGSYNNAPPPPSHPVYSPHYSQSTPTSGFPSLIVKNFAATVAEKGDQHEDSARSSNNPLLWFLNRPDSEEYRLYRDLVLKLRAEKSIQQVQGQNFNSALENLQSPQGLRSFQEYGSLPSGIKRQVEEDDDKYGARKRRSRWGPQDEKVPPPVVAVSSIQGVPPPIMLNTTYPPQLMGASSPEHPSPSVGGFKQEVGSPMLNPFSVNIPGITAADVKGQTPVLSMITRTNPQLLDYARQSYGTIYMDEEQWKRCEEAYKMNLLFQDIARKKAKDEKLSKAGKFKHEYDSDEEIDDEGTWEHKRRLLEMEKTKELAQNLTDQAKGKHHIGDFLPPEELAKFMDKYKAVKEGKQMTESAYEDFKIAQDNVGFKLLQKMGWSDGQGLGSTGQGITTPIEKGTSGAEKYGLGLEQPDDIQGDDDEYAAYRKRMMLAYRFRPNPLNNPRRAYY